MQRLDVEIGSKYISYECEMNVEVKDQNSMQMKKDNLQFLHWNSSKEKILDNVSFLLKIFFAEF